MTDDVELALRTSLAEQARRAPSAELLAERIIDDARSSPSPSELPSSVGWRVWTLPLLAAAAVAVIVAGLVAVGQFQDRAAPARPAGSNHAPATGPGLSSKTHAASTGSPTPQPSPSPSTAVSSIAPNSVGVTGFRVLDLSFVGANDGWALGTAQCLQGSGSCTALARTSDGRTWTSMPGAAFNVAGVRACADPCVTQLRFANDQIGYAFGPTAMFLTTDGGGHWLREPGGADALETLDNNVIRVYENCPGCGYHVEIAPLGATAWQHVALPGAPGPGNVVQLARTGHSAYLADYGNPAGGVSAQAVLYVSSDDGASWTRRGEPCPQLAASRSGSGSGFASEVDSTAMTSAPDGSVTVLCTVRGGQGSQFTSTASASIQVFRPGNRRALGAARVSVLAAASATTLFVSSDDLYRSTDGGQSFARQHANAQTGPGRLRWLGFESATAGRAVSADGRTVWTTQDAGTSWRAYDFP